MEQSLEMSTLMSAAAGDGIEFDEEEDISSRYRRVDSFDLAEKASFTAPKMAAAETITITHNLDQLFQQLYEYYHAKGFSPQVLQWVFQIISVYCTVLIAAGIMWCLDWRALNECFLNNEACHTFSHYLDWNALHAVLTAITLCVAMPMLVQLSLNVRTASRLRRLFLLSKISTRDLQTMQWSTVVSHLRKLQQKVFFVKNGMKVNALHVAMRIMRRDNFKILVYSSRVLPLGSPAFGSWDMFSPSNRTWYMSAILERNLDFAFFSHAIVDSNTFVLKTRDTSRSVLALNFQLKCLAFANLIFMPALLVWTFVFFLFQYAEEFHSKRNYLGPRWFTPHALWLMREYNELPHQFEKRASQSVKHSEKYLRQFINPVLVECARGLTFVLGAFVITLLLIGLVDDSVLLHVTLWDRNLVWYLALLTPATAALRGLVPTAEESDAIGGNPNVQMRRIASYTHLYPDHWRGKANTYEVKESFESLVPNRIVLLLRELMGVCVNWYILGIVLPRHTEELIALINNNTAQVDGVGEVCLHSLLAPSSPRSGDPKWEALLHGKRLGFPSDFKTTHPLVESKVEKSFLQFKISYSKEICGLSDAVGDELLLCIRAMQRKTTTEQQQQQQEEQVVSMSMSMLDQQFHLVVPEEEVLEEALLGGVGEDVFWCLEQWRDEEMKRRQQQQPNNRW